MRATSLRELSDKVRAALNATNETDTFFAPTDAAIDSFTEWGGFNDTKAALQELFGDVEWKGYIIAYHAVPDLYMTRAKLASLRGDDRYLICISTVKKKKQLL